ncbi:MAG: hypothetical protein K2K69_09510, partial [Muribaculaceae bacterium]|nr:hypothetical protein [Muribaculaceae bacterium]
PAKPHATTPPAPPPRSAAATAPGGQLTVSGFYVQDRDIIEAAARAVGFTLSSVADCDNWSSMTFIKQ